MLPVSHRGFLINFSYRHFKSSLVIIMVAYVIHDGMIS
ncbi:hypothetical protein Nizo2535_1080 [Lactiplantibacillus plantarum]|nr:hypothetical protein Nizo2535_1080 [Lactiplantibacillus plantarum]KZU75961.1 hypothetical protein Nizo2891_2751 [Lactiplantibacillus plantarum]